MNPWPIAPIADTDLNFAVVSYDFASFTNNEEADLPSLEGAIDTSLLDYAGSIADQTTLIASLFSGLDDVFTVLNEIGGDDLESIFGSLANTATQGDAILVSYDALIGDNSGSGGGGGGGGTPGACAAIDFGSIPTSTAGAANSVTTQWLVGNTTGKDLHVTGAPITAGQTGVFFTDPEPNGSTIPAGGTLSITIVFAPPAPGTYNATMTLETDGPDPQPCANLTGTATGPNLLGGPPAGNPPTTSPTPAPSGGGTPTPTRPPIATA